MKKMLFLILIVLLYGCAEEVKVDDQIPEEIGLKETPGINDDAIEVVQGQTVEGSDVDDMIVVEDVLMGFTAEDVAEHGVEEDCWVVYEGKVYDFTNTKMHPNMAKVFYSHCGSLTGFEEAAKAKHSSSNEERVSNYGEYLGELI